jgi:hypothetical protein
MIYIKAPFAFLREELFCFKRRLSIFASMIRQIFNFSIFLFYLFVLSSCEKDIKIDLHPSSTDLVVDGSIENGKYPVIKLSKSLDYFSKLDPSLLSSSFVHHAIVTVSTGDTISVLVEDSVVDDSTGIKLYYYTTNIYTGPKFKGQFNSKYKLEIQVGNQTYTASTTIPALNKFIDSLWWVPAPAQEDSALVNLKARVKDPPGFGNYTRYFTKVNDGLFYPGLNSVFDDQVTDGTTYTVTVDRGVDRNFPINFDTYSFFNKGDSVLVKLANIDKATYDFWRTMEYNYQSVGNPFSSPTSVISNISNGALGYFGGYAAQYKGVLIPF